MDDRIAIGVGFLLGMGFSAGLIMAFSAWAASRPFLPGPFFRPDYDKKP